MYTHKYAKQLRKMKNLCDLALIGKYIFVYLQLAPITNYNKYIPLFAHKKLICAC